MQDALERLSQDASKQTWFAGLDDRVRPVALAIVAKALKDFCAYAARFNTASRAPMAHPSSSPRIASLAMGVARDCNDIVSLLGPLADENTFKGGAAVYNTLKADLTTLSNLLTEQITPAQAVSQSGVSAASTSARGSGEGPVNPAPSVLQSPAVTPGSYQAITAPTAYSREGEQYMDQTYQRELHQPGSPEGDNELQNSMAWGLRNGGLSALVNKMQQDGHTPQFIVAVQRAWGAKGLATEPISTQGTAGSMSTPAARSAQKPSAY